MQPIRLINFCFAVIGRDKDYLSGRYKVYSLIPDPDINDANADVQGYYASITDLLNATSPKAFTPSISQLDALIKSMWVAP